jgi:3'-phosphoadenosine 5'-phosphosulfate sulfotransferase (PAPS reductase)/FAD synthetase
MSRPYFLSSSCGNDSVAMMVKAAAEGVPFKVVYSHTGWASKKWAARIELVRSWAGERGIEFIELNKDGLTFPQLIHDRKGFPMPGKTWCSLHLKALPFLTWADEVDPTRAAIVMVGKRRDESPARKDTPEWVGVSDRHGDRTLWHPLAYVTEADRDKLLTDAGFEVLPHRSGECTPCVNANRKDMVAMEQDDIDKTEALEGVVGQNMFRPHHHMGARGFTQVIKWAHSPRGKYEPPEIESTCTEGYCE